MERGKKEQGEDLSDEVHAIWDWCPRAMLASGLLGDYVGQAVRGASNHDDK